MFRVEKKYFDGTERVHWADIKDLLYAERIADNAYRADNELEWVGVVEQDGTVVHERSLQTDGQFRRTAQEKADLFRHARGEHRDGYRDTPEPSCPACYEATSI